MKAQLLFCFLALAISAHAQQKGFSYFSSHSGVDVNEDGKKFIYTMGEPINTYVHTKQRSAPAVSVLRQGLLHTDIHKTIPNTTEIQVRVFFDEDSDGIKGPNEQYITEGNIQVEGDLLFKVTSDKGITYYASPGTYRFIYFNQNDLFTYSTTRSIDVDVEDGDIYKQVDFGISPEEVIEQAQLFIATEPLRCFRPVEYTVGIRNTGSLKLNNTLFLEIDERLVPIDYHQEPDVILADNIVGWNVCLEPGQIQSFSYGLTAPEVDSPDDIGVLYNTNAWIDLQNNGTISSSDTVDVRENEELVQELLCAYDPNDKLVNPNRPDSLALLDEPLTYTIRFQNTGNDVADDVVVVDTLDTDLDMSTFYVLNSSHPDLLDVLVDEDNPYIINFQFKNIFLPDSTSNEPGSNGHIVYSISPKEGLPINTEINNTAYIYFDFNPAIITNTTSSTLVDTFPIPKEDITTKLTKIICAEDSYEGYTETGVYEDVFSSGLGYDSIRILKLFVLEPNIETIQKQICFGESYLGYSESGFYRDTISATGCGSIIELELEVSDNYESYEQVELCSNEVYKGYSGGGYIVERYRSINNCDSTHTIELVVSGGNTAITKEICEGESYEGYNLAGTYEDVFTTDKGCDSIRTLELILVDNITSEIEQTICFGETYEGYTASGTYQDNFSSLNGCDSMRTLVLTVEDNLEDYLEQQICQGDNYEGYTESGTYEDNFIGINGCDSTRILALTVAPIINEIQDIEICEGEDFEGFTTTGTYEENLTTNAGCDSTRTINLNVLPNSFATQDIQICEGEDYEGYTTSGIYEDILVSATGCDSVNVIHLTVDNTIIENISLEICQGDSYEGYTTSGTHEDNYTTTAGCDSVRILNLTVTPATESYEEVYLCIGESYDGYDKAGRYSTTYTGISGCDSIKYIDIIQLDRDDPICAYQYDRDPHLFDDTAFLDVFPNPTADFISVVVDKPSRLPSQLEIMTIERKLIHKQIINEQMTDIDLSAFDAGIYILILRSNNNIYVHQIVKL